VICDGQKRKQQSNFILTLRGCSKEIKADITRVVFAVNDEDYILVNFISKTMDRYIYIPLINGMGKIIMKVVRYMKM
jgi:hypothetical protein